MDDVQRRPNRSRLFSSIAAALVLLAFWGFLAGNAEAAQFTDLISFGDSLSDVGNVAGITTPGIAPLVNGYYQQTHFSDNVIWNETLAAYLGLPARTPGRIAWGGMPAALSGNTWAWGGSESSANSVTPSWVTAPIPGLLQETSSYLSNFTPNSTTLYSIWSGADNLLVGNSPSPAAAQAAVSTVKTAMTDLERAGARHLLVFNMPKIGDTPYAQDNGPAYIAAANVYSTSYDTAMNTAIAELRADPAFRAQIYYVDVYTPLEQVVTAVKTTGTYTPNFFVPGAPVTITNVTDKALTYFDNHSGTYPDGYFFWDIVHPTTQGHALVAGLALQALSVPEVDPAELGAVVALVAGALGLLERRRW